MKKILYIITIPDWGGAQRYVFDLANKSKNSYEVIVASGKSEGASQINLLEKCRAAGIATRQFKNLARPINPIKDILAVFEIKKYLEKEKPNTIRLNSSKAGVVVSLAAALLKHRPEIVYTAHGWVFLEPMRAWKKYLYIFLEKLASRWRDKIIVLGEKEKQIALAYKIFPENKIEIINHAVPEIKFLDAKDAREKLELPQNKKIIGTIANFFPSKGLQYLIEAASKINDPNIIFSIIGDGPERKDIGLLVTRYSLQTKLFLLGEKENAAQYLKAFDVFILPSVKEGAPYVILEAMAAGLPIVATDVGNVGEMLRDYQNKTIVPPADVELLKKAIENKITGFPLPRE